MTQTLRRSTMVDVAREAGVSLKTVSRVLNEENYVREETRTAVLDAATKLDYKLNQAARTLRSGAAQIVVLLVNNPSRSYLENIHLGALERCHDLSMQLVLDNCPDGLAGVKRMLDTLSPVGLIVTPPLCDDADLVALLDSRGCHYVLVAPFDPASTRLSVNMDDIAAARQITEYLLDLGHQRIGFISGHPEHGASRKRFDGYSQALQGRGMDVDESLIRQGYFDYASGLECSESLLDMTHRPTAIFACNDDMAAATISAAYRRNIQVPDALSVVGFDDTPIAAIISPHLTTVCQPIGTLGSDAVTLLSDNISRRDTERKSLFLDYRITERESAGPPPG